MPGPALTPFHSDTNLPNRVDVVVIGGGIVGASTALELAERGLSVLLCEKGEIGGEQSSRNWGWVRLSKRDPREIPLMIEAIRLWQDMDRRTGRSTGYNRCGILFMAQTDRVRGQFDRWSRHLGPHQIDCRMVERGDLDTLVPGHRISAQGGLYTPLDGRAEPQWAAPAIAQAARDAGASVMTGCAVRTLDTTAGRVSGVITEAGRVACNAVVLAAGAWSRLFAGNAGVELPQLKVLNSVMRTGPVAGPELTVWSDDVAVRRRADGGYTVACGTFNVVDLVPDSFRLARQFLPALRSEWSSLRFRPAAGRWRQEASEPRRWTADTVTPFERTRVLDPEPHAGTLRRSWYAARRAFPVFEGTAPVQSWAGLIDVTPDAIPIISSVEDLPGFHIATGFSGHGFGIGPGAGRLMADLVTGAKPVVDPTAFRLSRFTDGSRVQPDHGH